MKNYIVFYGQSQVAEFDTIKECKEYVFDTLKMDNSLKIKDFYIYSLIG